MQEHINAVLSAANTQTCLNSDLRESMQVVARSAAIAAAHKTNELNNGITELSNSHFAARLKALRQARNITQNQLAELCGWTQSRIGNYERAKREPSFTDINLISKALGVLPSQLLFG